MIVKVRYHDILAVTEKAILFLIVKREIWFPKSAIKFRQGRNFTCHQGLAEAKGVSYSPFFHFPDPIEPKFNQEPMDELKY